MFAFTTEFLLPTHKRNTKTVTTDLWEKLMVWPRWSLLCLLCFHNTPWFCVFLHGFTFLLVCFEILRFFWNPYFLFLLDTHGWKQSWRSHYFQLGVATMHSARLAEGVANPNQVMVVSRGRWWANRRITTKGVPPSHHLRRKRRSFEDAYMHFTAQIRKCHTWPIYLFCQQTTYCVQHTKEKWVKYDHLTTSKVFGKKTPHKHMVGVFGDINTNPWQKPSTSKPATANVRISAKSMGRFAKWWQCGD